jgi:hypothetical protein
MFDLIISTPENKFLKAIEFNFEELKKSLSEHLTKYQNIIYTDDSIADAKADRAELNKLATTIENQRKIIKQKCLEPYEVFEAKTKELVLLIEEPKNEIDRQVKNYEEELKKQKLASIEKYWEEKAESISALIRLEMVFDPKWMNASTTKKQYETQIDDIIQKAESEIESIKNLKSGFEHDLLNLYSKTMNLASVLQEKTRFEEATARAHELKKEREEAAKRAIEAKISSRPNSAAEVEHEPDAHSVLKQESVFEEEKEYSYVLKITATKSKLYSLKNYMSGMSIRFEKVE